MLRSTPTSSSVLQRNAILANSRANATSLASVSASSGYFAGFSGFFVKSSVKSPFSSSQYWRWAKKAAQVRCS